MEWTKKDDAKASHWDKIVTLTEDEASRLYAGQWPDGHIPNPDSLRFIQQELQNKNLRCDNPLHLSKVLSESAIGSTIGGKIVGKDDIFVHALPDHQLIPVSMQHCQISYQSLIDLAKANGHFPPTLFPDKRPKNKVPAKPAIPKSGFHVVDNDYFTVYLNGTKYPLSTDNRRQVVKTLHKNSGGMKVADLNAAVNGYEGKNIVADAFKGDEKTKKVLLANPRHGFWKLKGL